MGYVVLRGRKSYGRERESYCGGGKATAARDHGNVPLLVVFPKDMKSGTRREDASAS